MGREWYCKCSQHTLTCQSANGANGRGTLLAFVCHSRMLRSRVNIDSVHLTCNWYNMQRQRRLPVGTIQGGQVRRTVIIPMPSPFARACIGNAPAHHCENATNNTTIVLVPLHVEKRCVLFMPLGLFIQHGVCTLLAMSLHCTRNSRGWCMNC